MVAPVGARHEAAVHASDLFAMPFEMLFDAVGRHAPRAEPMEVPLWSGLRLHALPMVPGDSGTAAPTRRQPAANLLPPTHCRSRTWRSR